MVGLQENLLEAIAGSLLFLKADFSDASGSTRHPDIWVLLVKRTRQMVAHAFIHTISGHCLVPEWIGLPSGRAPIEKGCKQGAPEGPVL